VQRPLRILHILANLHSGGVSHLLAKSLAEMDRVNFRHQVCCITTGGVYQAEIEALGVPVHILTRRHRFSGDIIRQMVQLMRREKTDVVHTLNFTANAWGRVAAILARVPRIIAHERGTAWTDNRVMRLVNRALYPATTLMLANSEAARIILRQHVGLPDSRLKVIYNGLPMPKFDNPTMDLRQTLDIQADAPLIGAIGRLDTPKGYPFLLQSLPYLWQEIPTAHVAIIGTGPLTDPLRQLAVDLRVMDSGRLHFMGFVPNAAATMPQLDLLLHPAIREAFGNVLVEAGFAALPAIAANVDGCAEVIVDEETGMLVDCTEPVDYIPAPGVSPLPEVVVDGRSRALRPPLGPNPRRLAECAVALLRNPDLRLHLGRAAKARSLQLFALGRFVCDLEAIYRSEAI
jgi:glycosyltransferase involved in cell wall biosynthesis